MNVRRLRRDVDALFLAAGLFHAQVRLFLHLPNHRLHPRPDLGNLAPAGNHRLGAGPVHVPDAAGGGRPDAHDLFHHREVGAGYGQEKVTPPQKLFPD